MADDIHTTALVFTSEGAGKVKADSETVVTALNAAGAAEDKYAGTVETATARRKRAREAAEKSSKSEAVAAAQAAGVVATAVDSQVIALRKQEQIIARAERTYQPLVVAARNAAKEVEALQRVIARGIASPDADLRAQADRASAVLPAAIKARDEKQAAALAPDPAIAKEQERLNAATDKYLDLLDKTRPATRQYNADLLHLAELQQKGEISSLGAAVAEAKLTEEYQKQIHILSGVADAERKAAEAKKQAKADAQAAEDAQERLSQDAQKYLDKLNPLLPVQRDFNKELERLAELAKSGNLTLAQAGQAGIAARKNFDQASRVATGEDVLDRQAQEIKDRINPAGVAQRNYANAVDRVNELHRKGKLDAQQYAAAIKLVEADLKAGALSTRGMQFAVTNFGFQVNDVVTGVLSGQQPFRIFAQQAGQFVQVFQQGGGVSAVLGGVVTWLRSMITPLNVAIAGIAGLTAGFALLVARTSSATSSVRQFDVMLRGMNANSLAGGADLEAAAKRLRDVGLAASEARDRIRSVVRAGLNPASAERIVRVQEDLKPVLGDGAGDQLTSALSGGLEDTIKFGLSPALRAFNADQITTWREMARGGQAARALDQAFAAIERAVKGANNDALSPFQQSLRELATNWNEALDALSKTKPIEALVELLNNAARGLERLSKWDFSDWNKGIVASAPIPKEITSTSGALDMNRLVQAVIDVESGGNTRAVSSAGAAGLMQLMPGTAARYGVTDRFNGEQNVAGGTKYLRDLLAHYNGNVEYALMAYNWGEGNLDKALAGMKSIPSQVRNYARTVISMAGGADALGASESADNVKRGDPASQKAEVTKLIEEEERRIEVLQRVGAASDVVAAKQEAQRIAAEKELPTDQKIRLEAGLIADVYKRKAAEQAKLIGQTELEISGVRDTAKAYSESVEAGLKAEAQAKATGEAFQAYGELQSDAAKSFIETRSAQLLQQEAFSAIKSGREQIAAEQPRLAAEAKLLDATLKGTEAQKQQEIQNAASARAQDALAKARAANLPGLATEAKAVEDAALAQEKYRTAIEQGKRAAEAANDNRRTLQQVQFETQVVSSGVSYSEQTRQLAYFDALQKAALEFGNVDVDAKAKAARDAYLDTAKAVADAKFQLTEVQREQERWNDLVRDLANTIENELTRSIENAFSEDKVESWGKRIQRWIGTATSQLSSSLFIKPALGTVAGALGFGTVAQSLGSFGSLTGGSSTAASGATTLTDSSGNVFTLSNVSSAASLGNSLGLFDSLGLGGVKDFFSGGLGGIFAHTPTAADFAAGVGPVVSAPGSIFGTTTLGSALGGIGAGFGAGSLLNSLLGGNKLYGTAGSGVGSLLGTGIGSLFGSPILGGITGGLFGSLGGLLGNSHPRSNATGLSIDLATGAVSGYQSSGSAENDRTAKEIRDSLTDFTKTLQDTSGGTLSGYVNPQATDQGIKLDYSIPGFGSGTYSTKDSQDAIDTAELAIARGLTGISDTMKTVIDQITDPAKLDAAIEFAKTYDKIADAAKDAFSSIPSDLQTEGPFAKAKDDIKTTFDDIEADAKKFGLSLQPITDALDEANRRLTKDFDRYISDLTTAIDDPLQSLVDIEKRAGDARVKDAKEVAGDIEAVNKLNAKNLDKIWKDQTQSLQDLADELRIGDLSGLTATQRLGAANDNYKSILSDVQAGKTSRFNDLVTSARNLFSLSTDAYGQGPKTAGLRTDILAAIDDVLASRSFASGGVTRPGWNRVGEQGEEWLYLPSPAMVLPHGQAPASGGNMREVEDLLRDLLAAMRANTGTARQGHYETGKKLDEQTSELRQKPLYEPTRRKVA